MLPYIVSDRLSTLLRHGRARLPALPVPGLALRMELAAARGRLVPPVRGPLALPPSRSCAGRTTVDVAAVTAPADDNLSVTADAVEEPLGVVGVVLSSRSPHEGLLYRSHPAPPPAALRAG